MPHQRRAPSSARGFPTLHRGRVFVSAANAISSVFAGALRSTLVFAAAATVIVLLGLVPELLHPIHIDNAWLLQSAGRLMDGWRLYDDLVEIMNPPLIIWLYVLPVGLARSMGASPILVFHIGVALIALVSVVLCRRLIAGLTGPDAQVRERALTLLVLFVLFPLLRDAFGQREHLILALTLPFLFLASRRAAGLPVPAWVAAAIGGMAAVGMAIKPFYFLLWVTLEAWVLLAGPSEARRLRPETVPVLALALLYPILVVLFVPSYLPFVRLVGGEYMYVHRQGFIPALLGDRTWLPIGGISAFLVLRRAARFRHVWTPLAITTTICLALALAQQKGFRYHFYPALALGIILLGGLSLDLGSARLIGGRRLTAAAAGAAAVAALVTAAAAALTRAQSGLHWRDSGLGRVIAFVRQQGPGQSLFVLHSGLREAVLAAYSGAKPASQISELGLLLAVHREALRTPTPLRYHEPGQRGPLERFLVRRVRDNLAQSEPHLVLVIQPGPDRPESGEQRFDYLGYFSSDSVFSRLIRRYTFTGSIGRYDAYRRLRPGEPPDSVAPVRARTVAQGAVQDAPRISVRERAVRVLLFLALTALLVRAQRHPDPAALRSGA
jgi:hypothetical protein